MMKIKRKGKIHPSPPQPTYATSQPTSAADSLSVLNLLPSAILALAAVLSLQDREVLAYMITRSLKTTTTSTTINNSVHDSKKLNRQQHQLKTHQKIPLFDCDCFDCYTSFWFRWDSSPNRELIHQAIEAFEEHLATGELQSKKKSGGGRRNRKKEKLLPKLPNQNLEKLEQAVVEIQAPVVEEIKLEKVDFGVEEEKESQLDSTAEMVVVVRATPEHKGLARKVLPDVLGVLNSRLWNLWGPNV